MFLFFIPQLFDSSFKSVLLSWTFWTFVSWCCNVETDLNVNQLASTSFHLVCLNTKYIASQEFPAKIFLVHYVYFQMAKVYILISG